LDELPQLGDVALGNLALVGPRLCTRAEWDCDIVQKLPQSPYSEFYKLMTSGQVMPGILGAYWMVGGKAASKHDRYWGEVEYINNASMMVDWRIVWGMVRQLGRRRRLYNLT
jgi:lipopolysaccharide/colanic/teichoic acid biosynthesis glycosyltransferase